MKRTVALPVRTLRCRGAEAVEFKVNREWLVTNGLGGYASGTIANVPTRRYHGLLIAALPAPLGRTMMLHHLSERLRLPDGKIARLDRLELAGGGFSDNGLDYLVEFRLEGGLPVWRFELADYVIEKRVVLTYEQNTTHVLYRLLQGQGSIGIELRPRLQFRGQEEPVDRPSCETCVIQVVQDRHEIMPPPEQHLPPLRLYLHGQDQAFTADPDKIDGVFYRIEERRGYPHVGELWSPGYFLATLTPERAVSLVASTESWDTILSLDSDEALKSALDRREHLLQAADSRLTEPIARELVLAADQFIITPMTRSEDRARARAVGDDARTVIAGYHWFTDWGRDTMISLEGLTLATGRHAEAGAILRTFARHVSHGLLPNLFPEGQREGLYHTADATLWFFEAIARYLTYSGDRETLRILLPTLTEIYHAHVRGTRFGIGVDPEDGLLRQGAEGYALTWMDAKMGDWVVTPRRGKAVELNALWFNALGHLAGWLEEQDQGELAVQVRSQAARARHSFNRRFWCEERGYLYDLVDGPQGDDPCCRPNQLLAISLPHAILDAVRWEPVLRQVERKLLTPVGLRTLSCDHSDYRCLYDGDLRARDGAYHQGTVWPWLIGPFTDALLKVEPGQRGVALQVLSGLEDHLNDGCIGSIGEIFDGNAPYGPRGCIAQAWSVAEVLRSHLKIAAAADAAASAPAEEQPPVPVSG